MKITKTIQSKIENTDFDNLSFGKCFSDHMFSISYKNNKWQNPEILPYGPLSLNPGTHVFHYGQAIFEGMKAYKNEQGETLLFRPHENIKRLNNVPLMAWTILLAKKCKLNYQRILCLKY